MLETVEDIANLDTREEYWITTCKAYTDGYNLCKGGKQSRRQKVSIPESIAINILLEYPETSLRKLQEKYNYNREQIKAYLIANGVEILSRNKTSLNLSEEEKCTIKQLYIEGVSTKDIATKLSRSEQAVRRHRSQP